MLKVLPQALIQLLILGSILASDSPVKAQLDTPKEPPHAILPDDREDRSVIPENMPTTNKIERRDSIERIDSEEKKQPGADRDEKYWINEIVPFLDWPIKIGRQVPLYALSGLAFLLSLASIIQTIRKSRAQAQSLIGNKSDLLSLKGEVKALRSKIKGLKDDMADLNKQVLAASIQSSIPAASASTPLSMPPSTLMSPPSIGVPLASAVSPGAGTKNPESLIQAFNAPEDKIDDSNSKVTKEFLINALNRGDRQELKAQTMAGLNITKESENAWSTGRTVVTELEEAGASSSYFVAEINAEHWLFPTEKTLRSFTLSRSNKGVFKYEQQVLSDAQLVEPALLERSGHRWIVKSLGVIAVP